MPSDDEPVDEGKRNFLKVMVAVSVIAAAGGAVKAVLQNVKTPVAGITSFPTMQLYWVPPNSTSSIPVPLKTADFPTNSPSIFVFDYPLQGEPNFLLKLADASGKPIKIESTEVTIPATGAKFMSARRGGQTRTSLHQVQSASTSAACHQSYIITHRVRPSRDTPPAW